MANTAVPASRGYVRTSSSFDNRCVQICRCCATAASGNPVINIPVRRLQRLAISKAIHKRIHATTYGCVWGPPRCAHERHGTLPLHVSGPCTASTRLTHYQRHRKLQAKTDKVKGEPNPKFLKDLRLDVPAPQAALLTVELLQAGPRGDLVVGSEDLNIGLLIVQGTLVHWFPLRNAANRIGAELCMVLRYAPSK